MSSVRNIKSFLTLSVVGALALTFPAQAIANERALDRATNQGPPQHALDRRAEAQQNVEEKRQSTPERTPESRQDACEQRQENISRLMGRFTDQAQKHVSVFDRIHDRAQAFHDDNQLGDPDYDELNGEVIESRERAAAEVALLAAFSADIDCSEQDVAVTIAAYRDSVLAARISLEAYRSSLVLLIQSLRAEVANMNDQNDQSPAPAPSDSQPEPTQPEEESETEANSAPELESETESEQETES